MMRNKKYLFILILLLILTGCSKRIETGTEIDSKTDTSNSKGTLVCSREATAQNNAKVELNYEVDYKKGYVTKLHSTEKVITDDQDVLDTYEEAYRNIFKIYKDLKYYDNNVSRTKKDVTSDTVIQYDKVDMDKLLKLENTDDTVIKNGKVALSDWLEFAEKFGTKCKEK